MRIARSVRRLEAYTPGEQPKSRSVVKLNTNENPYPPSPACAKVLRDFDLDRLRRYPDPVFADLRAELAKLTGADSDCIFIGNGSDEVLAVAARTFVDDGESIASLDPSYSLYKTLAAIRNVKWTGADPADKAKLAKAKAALFLWTNPNAPTGTFADPAQIADFARRFPGVTIVDEAYADFAKANCMPLAVAPANRKLLVMRTFSKSYSLAGLRVGYCVGPKDLIDAMYKVKDSYNIDAIAQAVALAAVRDQAWMKANVAKVIRTRTAFVRALEQRGWDVLPSEANFVFARPPQLPAAQIFEELRGRHIYVRYFTGPKTGDRLRVTIGTDAQMKKLLKALDELNFQK